MTSQEINELGYIIIPALYNEKEITDLIHEIETSDSNRATFLKTDDLFAIRQFFKEVPKIISKVFNEKLTKGISQLFGDNYFAVKSIYFDKPESSNWFVAYHQDLTISV